ncbi:hypothetical protein [Sphingomonas sp. ERG5]|uniref:hypothetical protein n=1 Tax=Sphingomonas sp. ERG5 TaxID=1381597 RepID=UPI00054C3B07|nr:hypothetical protein [Sphingomonas sp. ERG5]
MIKLLKDLLYGGRNEYLDIVRLLALLGGLTFLALEVCEFAGLGKFDEGAFGASWAAVMAATVGAIYARNRSDSQHRQDGEPGQ